MAVIQQQADWARTALRLPRDLHREVHMAAKVEDRTFNGQVVSLIREGLQVRAALQQTQGAQA